MTEATWASTWMPVFVGLLALGGAVIGAAITYAVTRAQLEHERELVEAGRDRDLDERRGAFQSSTLLELQVALQRANRAAGAIHSHDSLNGQFRSNLLPASLNAEMLEAGAAVRLLSGRVADDRVRAAVTAAHDSAATISLARSRDEQLEQLMVAVGLSETAFDLIGERIRSLPPPPAGYLPLITSAVSPDFTS